MTNRIGPKRSVRPIVRGEQTKIEKAQKLPEPPLAPSPGYAALRLELSRRQLRLIDAQAYVKQALATSPLFETDAVIERGSAELMRRAAKGDAIDEKQIGQLVAHAIGNGEVGLSKLIDVIEAQREGFRREVANKGLDVTAFDRNLAEILDLLAEKSFAELNEKRAPSDRRAAMQSMLAAGKMMSCGFSTTALYLSFHFDYEAANGFTNEPGLPQLVKEIDAKGGAIVGVGGAIFDIGSTGSDLIVSVDASSLIADCIHTFTGILLAVDELVEKNGWDDARRAEEVQLRLTRGAHPETIAELTRLGLPGKLRDSLPKILDALAKKLAGQTIEAKPIPQDLWCRSDRQAERVAHLTRLALEGRIVAMTGDLSDPRVIDRVNRLLRAHGSVAKVVHFSNTLDYVADVQGICRGFGKLHLHPDAKLTTSAGAMLREPVMEAMPDNYYLVERLGSGERPAIHRAADWLGEGKLGDQLHQAVWETPKHVRDLVTWTRNLLLLDGDYPLPTNVEEYRALVKQMTADAFRDPERAQEKLLMRMRNLGRLAAYELADSKSPLAGIDFRLPQTFADLEPIADQIDVQFWAKGDRKERYLSKKLASIGIDAKEVPDLAARAEACRTYDDLRDLELAVSLEADRGRADAARARAPKPQSERTGARTS